MSASYPPVHLSDSARAPERRPWWRSEAAAIVGVWTLVGVLFASSMYVSQLARARPETLSYVLRQAALDVYTWAAITLLVFWLVRRFPPDRGRWKSTLLILLVVDAVVVLARWVLLFFLLPPPTGKPPLSLGEMLWRNVHGLTANFVTFWLLVALALAVEYARRYRERELRSSQLENQLTGAQLQMLKMQLHPHFLFNTLHAVSTLVHSDPDAAERMIASLSELLRTTLAREQAQEVTLREELEYLAPYLEIEQTRLGSRLAVRTEVDPQAADAMIPHLILQPLVENAVRHGIAPRREGGEVEISAARVNGDLRLVVRDNGRGMRAPGEMSRPGGIGLANTRARLEQLYGPRQRFEVDTAPDRGTRIAITIPFRTPADAPGAQPGGKR